MKAIDTNILARFIMQDDPVQAVLAEKVLTAPCYISDTVLLETAWLLSSRYRVGRAMLADTLRDILALPTITVSSERLIKWAVDRFAAGADFADMMHIVGARDCDGFVSFEHRLVTRAGPDSPVQVEAPR